MADSILQAELLAACSGLGYSDGIRYHREADCLETVKDLIRYLRRDDDSHQIRRALGETKVLQTDLLPIIKFYSDDDELFDVTLRLLVNLTNPVLLLFKEELPEEKITRQQYLQIVSHQRGFKEAFADDGIWSVLVKKLGEIMEKEWEEREEEQRLVVERILILVRNILVVAASPEEEKRTDDDASIHDQVLWALHLARFEDLILYIASSQNEQDLCLHVIEIVSLMLKEQDPSQLANAGLQRSQSEKEKDEKELLDMRHKEAVKKQQKIKKHYSARHSRFGGTYYVMNMKSISDRDLIAHKAINDIQSLNFDHSKRPKKTPKNRMPLKDVDITRRSTLAIRLFLQEFCIEFLSGAYNSLMYLVKDNLNRATAQDHDESYYLWAMKFFLEFNRANQFKVELITETLNIQSFHYIQTLLENYYESMTTDKKKIPLWSKRMHRALKAYQELLMTLSFMDKSDNPDVRESSKILKGKVFYVVEYRELVLILLQNFEEVKMTKTYLKDLVETTHIFLKLLDGYSGKQKHLIVQRKTKVKRKPKKKVQNDLNATNLPPNEETLLSLWDEKSDSLLATIKGDSGELPKTIPFDSVSDIPEDEQKEMAMRRINRLLRNGEFGEAVSLLRSSREVWPEGDIFGSENMDHFEELLCLRTIFMANIIDYTQEKINNVIEDPIEEVEKEDSDEEEEIQEQRVSEQEFDVVGYIRRFAHTKVLQAYGLLFRDFFKNSDNTNHCILRMFHRLAWDCKLVAIFFQASLFRTFQKIMEEPVTTQCHKDAVKFIKFIFRKFLQVFEVNSKVFVELLFWKTNKEALEIECGYDSKTDSKTSKKILWTEEEEDELHRLYDEFKENQTEEANDKDIIDLITDNLINQDRTRRTVINKLKELGLVDDIKALTKKPVKARVAKEWSEEEEWELKNLFDEYKDAVDPLGRITDHLTVKRPKNRIIEKIMELGLVQDRKELRKKRSKNSNGSPKRGKSKNIGERFLDSNNSDVESNNDNDSASEDDRDELSASSSEDEVTTRNTQVDIPPIVTPANIKCALDLVVEEGRREAVEWIAELLQETAEERERDGDFDPIPLLALAESCTEAMEDKKFQSFLELIGIKPPANHQEMFWRIPSNISVEGLKKRSQFLIQELKGESGNASIGIDEPLDPVSTIAVDNSRNEKQKKKPSKKGRKIVSEASGIFEDKENVQKSNNDEFGGNSDIEIPFNDSESNVKGERNLKKGINVESESDLDGILTDSKMFLKGNVASGNKRGHLSDEDSVDSGSPSEKKKKKKRRVITNDDSEEESNEINNTEDLRLHLDTELTSDVTGNQMETSGLRICDSEEDTPVKNVQKRGIMDSDDDDDDDLPLLSNKVKARVMIDSDED